MSSTKAVSKSLGMFLIILLCFMTFVFGTRPRHQRQAVVGELATGLTNTGTSFNALYEGQSPIDSYFGYPPTQIRSQIPNDDMTLGYGDLPRGGGGREGYWGSRYQRKLDKGTNYNNWNPYEKEYGQGWRGFGTGKNPYNVRPESQYGLKY